MNQTGTRAVASDWIDERTRLVYEANKVGRLACLFFEEVEHLLRHTYARGQQDMARRCAEAIHESVREVAPISATLYRHVGDVAKPVAGRTVADVGQLLDQFTAWITEAGKEEAKWG